MLIQQVVIVFTSIGCLYCQSLNDIDINDGLKKLGENVPELDNFNRTKLPKVADVEKILREKCKNSGAENAVELIKDQQDEGRLCIEQYFNSTVIQEELEKAEETGSMDEVFAKYCELWPTMFACFDNSTEIARQCMNQQEEKTFNQSLVILNDVKDFMCFKEGDRLAMFVAEGGVECLQERKDAVQECFNATLGSRIPNTDELSVTNFPTFLFSAKDCLDFDAIRICINKELEKCKNTTPANIVDALFKFMKKQMPCRAEAQELATEQSAQTAKEGVKAEYENGSWSISSSVTTLVIALLSMRMC